MATRQLATVLRHLHRLVGAGDVAGLADSQLLDRFANTGDEAAFEALVRGHGPMVLGVCRRILRDGHEAEDAFQATFLVLVRKAGAIAKRESVASWLYGVAYRIALRAKCRANRRRAQQREVPEMAGVEPTSPEARQEIRRVLDDELSRLPEKYRAPLVLHYLEGKTKDETAGQLGWTEGTVSGRLARAREVLRLRLLRRGVTATATLLTAELAPETVTAAVNPQLLQSTVQAAALLAAGQTSVIAVPVLTLAEGMLQSMLLTKIKMAAAVLLAIGLMGAGAIAYRASAEDNLSAAVAQARQSPSAASPRPAQAPADFSSIDQRVKDWEPTKDELRMDEIGWAKDLCQALRLAKENQRPVFLFAYSGEATEPNAIALRRC